MKTVNTRSSALFIIKRDITFLAGLAKQGAVATSLLKQSIEVYFQNMKVKHSVSVHPDYTSHVEFTMNKKDYTIQVRP